MENFENLKQTWSVKAEVEEFLHDFEIKRVNIFKSLNGLHHCLNNLKKTTNKRFDETNDELLDSFQVVYKNYTAQRDSGRKMKELCRSLIKNNGNDYSAICNKKFNKEKHWQEMQMAIYNYFSHCGDLDIADIFAKEAKPKMQIPEYCTKLANIMNLSDEELCTEALLYISDMNELKIATPSIFVLHNAIKILIIYNLKRNNIEYALTLASKAISTCTDVELLQWIALLTRSLITSGKDPETSVLDLCNYLPCCSRIREDFRGLIINNGYSGVNSLLEIFLSGIHSLPQIRENSERLMNKSTDNEIYLTSKELRIPLNVQGLKFIRHSIYVCPIDFKLYTTTNGLIMYDCGHVLVKSVYNEMKKYTKICQFCNNTITDTQEITFSP